MLGQGTVSSGRSGGGRAGEMACLWVRLRGGEGSGGCEGEGSLNGG